MTDIVNPIDPPAVPPVPQRNDEATFEDRVDEGFEFAFDTLPGYMQSAMNNVHQNTVAANERAVAANDSAYSAALSKMAAAESANDAEASNQSAMAALAAIGSASGLPSMAGKAGYVLAVDNAEAGVLWLNLPPPAAVLAPVNVSPYDGETGIMELTITGSSYYSLYGKPQKASHARISLSPTMDPILWDSGAVAGASTSVSGPALDGLIANSTAFYFQIRYQDQNDAWSEWSIPTMAVTAAQYLPTVIGTPFGGGFYVGDISYGGKHYKIIKAPKSAEVKRQWKTTADATPGTQSNDDGMANTDAMNNSSHPAAKYCKDYLGGGNSDWYLGAKNELMLLWLNIPPGGSSTPAAFKTGGAEALTVPDFYWSSSEPGSNTASAWPQRFSDGSSNHSETKTASYWVCPFRRIEFTP